MTVADTIIGMVVDALPGAYLWEHTADLSPPFSDLVVFDAIVPPQPPQRYVVVWPDDGTRSTGPDNSLVDDTSSGANFRWQVTCVAPDRLRSAWLAGQVRDALTDARPVVDDWSPGLIRHSLSVQPRPDETVLERPVVFAVDQYRLLAEAVPAGS